ncbi:MAG: prepilin-type N-terminal cleavage/methylation domain-containing protein [Kiritimatiellae bacterium]|nr:prepilin-type N-terminal cleavage/methylation domain-containing protein [Kiritimatiellia bacterium]
MKRNADRETKGRGRCPRAPGAAGSRTSGRGTTGRAGFTLIELLLALMIFAMVMGMAAGAFWSIMKAWNRGGALLERLHHGEYAMEQLAAALRGAAWFPSKPEAFGFWLDDSGGTGKSAANEFSWVTGGTSFLPPESPLRDGLHRISVTVDGSGERRGLVVKAWPHLATEVESKDIESITVATGVEGVSCEWYDFEGEAWSQEWEETNSLPKLVRVTLTMKPREGEREGLVLQRLVELEVAPELPGRERRKGASRVERAEEEESGVRSQESGRGGAEGGPEK